MGDVGVVMGDVGVVMGDVGVAIGEPQCLLYVTLPNEYA
jgi:hypothetical protein